MPMSAEAPPCACDERRWGVFSACSGVRGSPCCCAFLPRSRSTEPTCGVCSEAAASTASVYCRCMRRRDAFPRGRPFRRAYAGVFPPSCGRVYASNAAESRAAAERTRCPWWPASRDTCRRCASAPLSRDMSSPSALAPPPPWDPSDSHRFAALCVKSSTPERRPPRPSGRASRLSSAARTPLAADEGCAELAVLLLPLTLEAARMARGAPRRFSRSVARSTPDALDPAVGDPTMEGVRESEWARPPRCSSCDKWR